MHGSRGRSPAAQSPQQKKALSYRKDRRNGYGENDKSSRKAIPLRKALANRKSRHRANQALAGVPGLDEAVAAVVESSARHDVSRVGGWRKHRDILLVEHILSRRRGTPDSGA